MRHHRQVGCGNVAEPISTPAGTVYAAPITLSSTLARGHTRPATIESATLRMAAVVLSEDGAQVLRDGVTGAPDDAEQIGEWLADSLLSQGAATVLGASSSGQGSRG